MEQILFLVAVAVLSVLHSWWTKRNEKEPEEETSPLPGQPQPPTSKRPPTASWEDELRRLLEGDDGKTEPRPQPPVIVQAPRPVAPPTLPSAPRDRAVARPVPVLEQGGEMETGLPVHMPSLEQSAQSYLRASHLEQRVAEHMRGVDARVSAHVSTAPPKRESVAAGRGASLLRNRQSQQAVIVAGVILGPPKALE